MVSNTSTDDMTAAVNFWPSATHTAKQAWPSPGYTSSTTSVSSVMHSHRAAAPDSSATTHFGPGRAQIGFGLKPSLNSPSERNRNFGITNTATEMASGDGSRGFSMELEDVMGRRPSLRSPNTASDKDNRPIQPLSRDITTPRPANSPRRSRRGGTTRTSRKQDVVAASRSAVQKKHASFDKKMAYPYQHLSDPKMQENGLVEFTITWFPTTVHLKDLEGREAWVEAEELIVAKFGREAWEKVKPAQQDLVSLGAK